MRQWVWAFQTRATLFHFSPGHPKPAFFEKVQRGDQGKFFKNGPKSSPLLKGLKELAQMALSFNWNALKLGKHFLKIAPKNPPFERPKRTGANTIIL